MDHGPLVMMDHPLFGLDKDVPGKAGQHEQVHYRIVKFQHGMVKLGYNKFSSFRGSPMMAVSVAACSGLRGLWRRGTSKFVWTRMPPGPPLPPGPPGPKSVLLPKFRLDGGVRSRGRENIKKRIQARSTPVDGIQVQGRGAHVVDPIGIGRYLQSRGNIHGDIVVYKLAKIGKSRRNGRIGTGIPSRISHEASKLTQQGLVCWRER